MAVAGPTVHPRLGSRFAKCVLTSDGNHYLSIWGSPFGEAPGLLPGSFSMSTGDIFLFDGSNMPSISFDGLRLSVPGSTRLVTSQQVEDFMTGFFLNVTVAGLSGGGITLSSGGIGIEKHKYATPQFSFAGGYTWKLPDWSWLPPYGK